MWNQTLLLLQYLNSMLTPAIWRCLQLCFWLFLVFESILRTLSPQLLKLRHHEDQPRRHIKVDRRFKVEVRVRILALSLQNDLKHEKLDRRLIAPILLMEVIKSYLKLYVAERFLMQTVAAAEHCDFGALAEQQRNVGTIWLIDDQDLRTVSVELQFWYDIVSTNCFGCLLVRPYFP